MHDTCALGTAIGDEVQCRHIRGELSVHLRVGCAFVVHVLNRYSVAIEEIVIEIVPCAVAGDINRPFEMRSDVVYSLAARTANGQRVRRDELRSVQIEVGSKREHGIACNIRNRRCVLCEHIVDQFQHILGEGGLHIGLPEDIAVAGPPVVSIVDQHFIDPLPHAKVFQGHGQPADAVLGLDLYAVCEAAARELHIVVVDEHVRQFDLLQHPNPRKVHGL
ncbi:hypothetical protein D9M72_515420 [compost metagenome]